jgi:hypothetical protein
MTRPRVASAGRVRVWALSVARTAAVTCRPAPGPLGDLPVDLGPSGVAEGGRGLVGGKEIADARLVEPLTNGPLKSGRDAGQRVTEPVGEPDDVRGEVDVKAVQHPELVEQLVAVAVEPVDLGSAGAGSRR